MIARMVLAAALAAALAPPGWTAQARSARKGASAAVLPDAEIEKILKEKLAGSKLAVDKIQVRVQGGTAILEGQTDVLQHKGTATRMARTAGAQRVQNRIVVSEAARQKALENLSKGRRRAQVKRGEARDNRT